MNAKAPRILVPLDESALAERALDLGAAIADHTDATLTLLSVPRIYGTDLSWYYTDYVGRGGGPTDFVPLEELMAESTEEARDYLDRVASRLADEGRACEKRIAEETPARAIVQTADDVDAKLIAMSTHGRGGLTRWALGSVADKVLRTSTRPILLVRAGAEHVQPNLRHVLVALDGSDLAEKVLDTVRWIAGASGARITLVSVARVPDTLPTSERAARELTQMEQSYQQHLSDYLADHVDELKSAGIEAEAEVISAEDEADALIARNARGDADLIALTTHGRGGWSRWALGSVADRVIRHAETPVLVQRIRGED